jgi:hypothetical protein
MASLYGDPLSTGNLPSSSPVSQSFARDPDHGLYTGSGGDTDGPIWAVATDLGWLIRYNGDSTTPMDFTNTGIPGLTGIEKMGGDNYMLSAGSNLYKGYIDGTGWHTTQTIPLGLPSNTTDVAVNLNHIFVATQSSGVYRLDMDGSNPTQIDSGNYQSVDVLTFVPGAFDNSVIIYAGTSTVFRNIDDQGTPFGDIKTPNLGNTASLRGLAFYNVNGQKEYAGVQSTIVKNHAPDSLGNLLPNAQITFIPEPSAGILAALGLALLGRRLFGRK